MLSSFNTETLPNVSNSQLNMHSIANGYGSSMNNYNGTNSYSNLNNNSNTSFQENDLKKSTINLQNGGSNSNAKLTNSYATDYLNTVKENRSLYGNYVDNALAFDPHKEKKSVYNVVYETDEYNPWGIKFRN